MNTPPHEEQAHALFPYVLAVLLVAGGVYVYWAVSVPLGVILAGVGLGIIYLRAAVVRSAPPPADVQLPPDFQVFTRLCQELGTDWDKAQTTIRTMLDDPQTRDQFTRNYGLAFLAGCLAPTFSERKLFLDHAVSLRKTLSNDHLADYQILYAQHGEIRWRIGGDDWFAFWAPIHMDDLSMQWMQICTAIRTDDIRAAVQRFEASDVLRANWRWGIVAAMAYGALGERAEVIRQLQNLLLVYAADITHEEKAQVRLMLADYLMVGHETTTALKVLNQSYSFRRHLSPETTLELGYALGKGYLRTGEDKKAVNVLSEVAAIQFNYQDVQELLRQARSGGTSPRHQRDAPPPPLDPWEVLGVSQQAPHDVVKQAYRALMAQYHPDKVAHLGPDLQVVAEEKAKSLNHAYHTICTQQRW